MDETVSPCEDFFQYACGSWNRKYVIPEDKSGFNTFEKLHDELQIKLKSLLESHISDTDTKSTAQAKILYSSCVNTSEFFLYFDVQLFATTQLSWTDFQTLFLLILCVQVK